MYRHKETKDRREVEVALFFVSNESPDYGVFILAINLRKHICYR